MSPLISIVIVNYNRERYLGAAIESVLSQTEGEFELLIWDDGSTDRCVDIALDYAKRDRRVRVVAANHRGVASARQGAIAQTTGAYIGWVDSDDLLAPTALKETAAVLDGHPETGLVYTDYLDLDADGKVKGYGHRCRIPYSRKRLLVDFMVFHFRLLRRSVFDQVGGIDESCKYAEDYDLCLRLSEVTQVRRIRKPLYYYRHHSEAISSRKRREQIRDSQEAIARALERRGLAQCWEIKVDRGRFFLQRKQNPISALAKKASLFVAALPLTTAIGIAPAPAQNIIPNNDGTMTIVTEEGNSFTIDGGTLSGDGKNLFHSFQEFGLDAGQIANFLSNPAIVNILSRINGGNPSVIDGLIQVTGGNSNLFLINPAGVIFGDNASLNVPADFTATTATGIGFDGGWFNAFGANNYTNLVGNPNAFVFSTAEPGVIVNAGDLAVAPGQNLSLIGGTVVNTGTIEAPGGKITLTAVPGSTQGTTQVQISQEGQVLSLLVEVPTNSEGKILPFTAMDLPKLLTGPAESVNTGLSVSSAGEVQLNSGAIIPTDPGTSIVSGTLDASRIGAAALGGEISVLGDRVGLIGANLDASGSNGGGNVLIGGDLQGNGTVPNAQQTFVSQNSTIAADGIETGDGGTVIVWADENTEFQGTITARGGATSGDGGFVETSAKDSLTVSGTVDASALNGNPGTWLIDPTNISIVPDDVGDIGTSSVEAGIINSTLNGGTNVTITTDIGGDEAGNITQNSGAEINWSTASSLELQANQDITLNSSITATGDGAVSLNADRSITMNSGSSITTNSGAITLNANQGASPTSGNFPGIRLDDATISSTTGDILLQGRGGNAGEINDGIQLVIGAKIESTGTGADAATITLDGTAGDSNRNNYGVWLVNTNTLITSVDGAINITGTGNGTDDINYGIHLQSGAQIESTGTGANAATITLDGTGGDGTFDNYGVYLLDTDTSITSVDGAIEITGIGGNGTGSNNDGITIEGSRITSANGDISLTGTGNGSGSGSQGIQMGSSNVESQDAALVESTGTGNITLTGTGASGAEGILLENSSIINSGGGNISLTGTSSELSGIFIGGGYGDGDFETVPSQINSREGDITLTADEIDLEAGSSITGTGNLLLQPFNPTQGIELGGPEVTGNLDLTVAELGRLDGFSTVTIGQTNGSGAINIGSAGPIDLSSKTFDLTLRGGDTTFNNGITLRENGTLTLITNAGGTVTSPFTGTDITIGGDGTLVLNTSGSVGEVGNPLETAISQFTATSVQGNLFLRNDAALDLGTSSITGNLDITATTGNISDRGPVTVGGNSSFTTSEANADIELDQLNASGPISLNTNGQEGDARITNATEVNLGTSNVGGNLGATATTGNISDRGPVTVGGNSSFTTSEANADIELDQLNASGPISLNTSGQDGNATITATEVNLGTSNVGGNLSATATTGGISTSGPINAGENITLEANQNITTGDITNPGGEITITSNSGNIDSSAGTLNTSSENDGGAIALTAPGNITTAEIDSRSVSGTGGTITIESSSGEISTGNLNSSGASGGNIFIDASITITTGTINSSGNPGNGGNVTLDPSGNIQVTSINAQGGSSGRGGNVNITTEQFFRATGTFTDDNDVNASISTAGGQGGGDITIRHGGNGQTPFDVGDAATNGTAGAITSGEFTIASGSFLFNETEGNISIISGVEPSSDGDGMDGVGMDGDGIDGDGIDGVGMDGDGIDGDGSDGVGDGVGDPPNLTNPEVIDVGDNTIRPEQESFFAQQPAPPIVPVIDPLVAKIEESFSDQYEIYLGLKGTPTINLTDARTVLKNIEKLTGVKPALIYAVFTPTTVATGEEQPELPTDQLDLALVTATGKPIRLTVPGTTREQVLAVAEQLYNQVSNRRSDYLEPAQQMYQWLVAPLEEQLQAQGIENLLFIMDQGLRLVPVAALHDGNQFVAQRYSSGLSPSLSLTDTLYRDIKGLPVLAMGASEFTPDQNQQPLPAVEIEVPEIAGQIREGESFINQQFTLDNLKSSRQQTSFGIVHLATHADFQPGDVSQSYIQLFDRKLGLDQVRQLGLNQPLVELLVISACRSAYGDREAELGFGGLAVNAGVKSALASLWYVGDTGTLALMTEFYSQLETAPIKAEAVRLAQVAMIEGRVRKEGGQILRIRGPLELPPAAAIGEEDLSHPYYWAAFTLIGNPW